MAIFVVMEPPRQSGDDGSDGTVFVRDGFSFLAFLVPPLWLLWHRLWIEAILTFVLGLGLATLGAVAGIGLIGSLLSLLISIFVGLEGAALRIAAYRRRGWGERGVVEADSHDDAELRYFAEAIEDDDSVVEPPPVMPATPSPARPGRSTHALGLLHYPGWT